MSSSYEPVFKGPIEGFVVNSLKTNFWRIEASCTMDDAMQEARCAFLRVAHKYPGVEAPQFMALFKMAWHNKLTDLANDDTKLRAMVPLLARSEQESYDSDYAVELVGDLDNDGALGVAIRQAPREVQAVVNLFLQAPQEILDLALRGWSAKGRRKTDGSKRICRLLGLDEGMDVMQLVEDHFTK
ncbi:hypothetical protein ZHS_69 [Edwardsiella phage vB_EpM_ZHS]|nr:hypothetical protein ZHS_69 [Edwardsiella phage vB_EpM_ZHS]